jgi:F420-non-reducing hydrogenase small subunit
MGGIPSLANQFSKEQILRYVYEDAPTVVNETQTRPQCRCDDDGRAPTLPEFRNRVRSLDQVVQVDYYLPGCPPTPKLIKEAVLAMLSGQMPPSGSVLAPDVALCEQCKRLDSKPQDLAVEAYRRPHLMLLDPELCFLAQGVACMGPATRGGCESLCIQGNMPCTGCFGPTSHVLDQGAKICAFLASSVAAKDEAEIERSLAGVPDPVGTFYRYGFAKSIVRGRVTDG